MSTVVPLCIIESQYAPASATSLYSSPAGTVTIVDDLSVCNTSGSTATVSVYLVPNGGNAGASNLFVNALSLSAGANSLNILGRKVLNAGDFIAVLASTGSAIVVNASGRQFTT